MTIQTTVKADWTSIDTPIEHDGSKIVLPSTPLPMDYDDAINTIARVRDQEAQKFDVNETVKGAPWDAAVAIYRAMQSIYGVVLSESKMTRFGEIKPDLLTVHTGPGNIDRIQVPLGQMRLPNVTEPVQVGIFNGGAFIQGVVRKRDRAILVEIANKAREFMRTQSVYKGKAIRLKVDDDGDLDLNQQPEFIDLSRVSETDMIHTADTEAMIRTNILAPLKFTEACRKNRIPLKRGVLLEGRYGTGKSLTARVTAKVATDNAWTFIMLDRSQGLRAAIEFARTYQPCVIFAEDIDRAADREDEDVNDLVNLLDGMISKEMEMMVVLTTNFVEKIDKALLRPGRFDAVISILPPDAETAQRLIRSYGRDLISADVDLAEVGLEVSGQIPATIREVVERAKLGMLTEGRTGLTADDLFFSARGMKRHMALLEPAPEEAGLGDRFVSVFREVMTGVDFEDIDAATPSQVLEARNAVIRRVQEANKVIQGIGVVASAGAAAANQARENTEKLLENA